MTGRINNRWTAEQDAYLLEQYGKASTLEIGAYLGRTPESVRNRRYWLGAPHTARRWTEDELASLRSAYDVEYSEDIDLEALAASFGREKANVCRKARELGMTDQSREKKRIKANRRKFDTKEELSAHMSECIKAHFAKNGHPRGMAGKTHSQDTKNHLGAVSKARWQEMTDEDRLEQSTKMLKSKIAKYGRVAPNVSRGNWKAGWRIIGGIRKFYRSRWEANYARYLEWLKQRGDISDWKHEPETFWFDAIKRGVRSYLPDFRVWENDGSTLLHEVKGWMDARSRTVLRRMAKYHPGEKIVLIESKSYEQIEKKLGRLIDGWEWKS